MFVPCPRCGFLVALIAPRSGATEQRCPRCGQILANTQAPDTPTSPDPSRVPRQRPDALRSPGAPTASAAPENGFEAGRAAGNPPLQGASAEPPPRAVEASAAPAGPTPPPPPRGRREPSFARAGGTRAAGRRWPLYTGIAAAAAVLAAQLVLAQRDALAMQPRWRPLVASACAVTGCGLPPWREPSAFTMLDRTVQPKPGTPGVLSAQATFRNDAQWPQAWPTLVLSLSGVDGQPLGSRAFEPHEYAGGPMDPLAPGQSVRVQLDVVEPAPDVVAFAFDFR